MMGNKAIYFLKLRVAACAGCPRKRASPRPVSLDEIIHKYARAALRALPIARVAGSNGGRRFRFARIARNRLIDLHVVMRLP